MSKVYDRVQEAIKIFTNKTANLSSAQKAVLGLLVLGDALTEIYQAECRESTDADRAALRQDVLSLFHDVFLSLNIPYVPVAFKGVLEGLLTQPLNQGLDVLSAEFASLRAEIDAVLKS